jgi:hypothetical protein
MANHSSREPVPLFGSWRTRLITLAALALLAVPGLLATPGRASAQGKGRIPAIELDGGTGWLGTDRPLSLKELRGKIVILEFWTSC